MIEKNTLRLVGCITIIKTHWQIVINFPSFFVRTLVVTSFLASLELLYLFEFINSIMVATRRSQRLTEGGTKKAEAAEPPAKKETAVKAKKPSASKKNSDPAAAKEVKKEGAGGTKGNEAAAQPAEEKAESLAEEAAAAPKEAKAPSAVGNKKVVNVEACKQ